MPVAKDAQNGKCKNGQRVTEVLTSPGAVGDEEGEMMVKPPDPAPRHLRRRRFGQFRTMTASGGKKPGLPGKKDRTGAKRAAQRDLKYEKVTLERKRLAALLLVIFVAVSIPALILALLLLG